MSRDEVIVALAPSVLALADQALAAILAGDAVKAGELSEEAARRQLLINGRRLRSKNAKRAK